MPRDLLNVSGLEQLQLLSIDGLMKAGHRTTDQLKFHFANTGRNGQRQ